MRFLDIAVASGYAAICLTLIVAINPVAPREAAVEAAAQARLDFAISAYLAHVGLPFLTIAPIGAICESASEASNATLVIDVAVQGDGCGSPPPRTPPVAYSSLTLTLPGRTLMVEAWLAER